MGGAHAGSGARPRLCVILGGHFSATRGGAQYQAEVLVDELVKRDAFEIYYLCRHSDPRFVPKGYTIRTIRGPAALRRFGFFSDSGHLYRLLQEIDPAAIYQHGLKAYTGVAAFYAQRNGRRMVFHIASDLDVLPVSEIRRRGLRGISYLDKVVGEYGLRRAAAVVAQTEAQGEMLRRHYRRRADCVVKNFHPTPPEVIDKSGPLTIAWVANFKQVKRPEVFIDLAEDLAGECDARFVMIGRPGDPQEYAALHERIERLPNLSYRGELPHDEVNAVLARCHVLVNTSSIEGFPNTFVQAWMRRMPVVTLGLNNDGMFDDGRLGYCAPDYPALKARIRELAGNRCLRERVGASAQAHAMAEHSTENVRVLLEQLQADTDR